MLMKPGWKTLLPQNCNLSRLFSAFCTWVHILWWLNSSLRIDNGLQHCHITFNPLNGYWQWSIVFTFQQTGTYGDKSIHEKKCSCVIYIVLIMAAVCNRGAIIFLPCGFFYLLLSFFLSFYLFFPRLISAIADWMSTILLHVVWP